MAADPAALAELRAHLDHLGADIAAVDARAANTRAGYVYVISNIGSFGDQVVKIGMTRRLEPMDRVRELGDASVPLRFDDHALVFSDDAVGLEGRLHAALADRSNARSPTCSASSCWASNATSPRPPHGRLAGQPGGTGPRKG